MSALSLISNVLSEEKRIQILKILSEEALTADELKDRIGISRTGIEKHLSVLMSVGFIERRAYRSNRLKYLYFTTNSVEILLETLEIACENYISMREEELEEQLYNMKKTVEIGFLSQDEVQQEEQRIQRILTCLKGKEES